jgi:hypothetical protein
MVGTRYLRAQQVYHQLPTTIYHLSITYYELGGFTQIVLFEQPAPANEVPEVKLSGSAKRQRALAQLPSTNYQLSATSYHLPLAAEKRLFHRPHTLLVGVAAFNGLKTRARYVILSLIKNIYSIPAHTHHERSFDHLGRHKRTQAEAKSIRLSAVPHTWVCGQAEADIIILWSVAEPPPGGESISDLPLPSLSPAWGIITTYG